MYEIGKEEIDEVSKVIIDRNFFRYKLNGLSECEVFENAVAEKLNVKYALLVTSGTNAIVCALAGLGIGPGDEVIIPSYTFVATSLAVTIVGAIPIMANVDCELGISISEIESCITVHTKAIIPVHMDGLASDMDSIMKLAGERDLFVIEDTAQAFGGSYNGKRLGTIGDAGCFSFNCDKILTAGEGGLVVTNDRALYEKMFCMMDGSGPFNPCNKDIFTETMPFFGMSMRVSNITAAILNVQLKRLDRILDTLSERKDIIVAELSMITDISIVAGSDRSGDCSTKLHIRFSDPSIAAAVGAKLRASKILAYPPTMQPAHVCWKWTKMLGDNFKPYHPKVNPFCVNDNDYNYPMAKYMNSIDIIMSCLKYDIDYDLSLQETLVLAKRMKEIIQA